MFEQILAIDILAALLLPAAWGLAGYLAGRLAFRRTRGRLLVSVRITFAVLGLAGLLVVAKLLRSSSSGHTVGYSRTSG